MSLSKAELDLLQAFERGLDPRYPERSEIPATVLGYGEISTVFAIQSESLQRLAFKRLPLFHSEAEVEAYLVAYAGYNRLLQEEIGLHLPDHSHASFPNPAGRPIVYLIQRQLPALSIGNRVMQTLTPEMVRVLVRRILHEMQRVWEFNQGQDRLQVALDGQISNWSIDDFDPQNPHVSKESVLTYLDTSTPLYRIGGIEQLNTELFLRSAPSFLVWILRLFFLDDVVNRYYDLHKVTIDLAANFYKEQRADLIPAVIAEANDFFAGGAASLGVEPLTEKEVRSYYREDALIWSLYLSMRRLDRLIRTRLRREEYPYILPGKIKR